VLSLSNQKGKFMKHAKVVVALLGGWLLMSAVHAQTTNPPATLIETAESQPDVAIVKGFGQVGSVNIGQGVLSVGLKETFNIDNNIKWYGLALEYQDNSYRERAVLDYGEIESLIKGMDYIGTISYNVTTLPGFQAVYQTKAGFRITGSGSGRQSSIQMFLQFDRFPRMPLEADQLNQLRSVIAQGLNTLDGLKSPK
jgi:hypothetical protein